MPKISSATTRAKVNFGGDHFLSYLTMSLFTNSCTRKRILTHLGTRYVLFFGYRLKFIYSEKATKFCEISTLLLSYVVPVKSKVEISGLLRIYELYIWKKVPLDPFIHTSHLF